MPTTPPTGASHAWPTSSGASSRRSSFMDTSIPTAPREPSIYSAAPSCATWWAITSSRSNHRLAALPRDTGFPRADVENDFLRVRRREVLARLAQRLRREPDDVNLVLPFDEVVAALGYESERPLGLKTIRLDTVVGTVDSRRDFD